MYTYVDVSIYTHIDTWYLSHQSISNIYTVKRRRRGAAPKHRRWHTGTERITLLYQSISNIYTCIMSSYMYVRSTYTYIYIASTATYIYLYRCRCATQKQETWLINKSHVSRLWPTPIHIQLWGRFICKYTDADVSIHTYVCIASTAIYICLYRCMGVTQKQETGLIDKRHDLAIISIYF